MNPDCFRKSCSGRNTRMIWLVVAFSHLSIQNIGRRYLAIYKPVLHRLHDGNFPQRKHLHFRVALFESRYFSHHLSAGF